MHHRFIKSCKQCCHGHCGESLIVNLCQHDRLVVAALRSHITGRVSKCTKCCCCFVMSRNISSGSMTHLPVFIDNNHGTQETGGLRCCLGCQFLKGAQGSMQRANTATEFSDRFVPEKEGADLPHYFLPGCMCHWAVWQLAH